MFETSMELNILSNTFHYKMSNVCHARTWLPTKWQQINFTYGDDTDKMD